MKSGSQESREGESSEKSISIYPQQDPPDIFDSGEHLPSYRSDEYFNQTPKSAKGAPTNKGFRGLGKKKSGQGEKIAMRRKEANLGSDVDISSKSREARLQKESTKSFPERSSNAENMQTKIENERFPFSGPPELCSLEDFTFVEKPKKVSFSVQDLIKEPVRLKLLKSERAAPHTLANLENIRAAPNLPHLLSTTFKLFVGEDVKADDLEMDEYEELIFNDILKRKFDKNFKKKELSLSPEKKIEILKKISYRRPQKRPEECYKFIFTRIFKHLKTLFKDESGGAAEDFETKFYKHYFGEVSEKEGIALESFFYRAAVKSRSRLNLSLGSHYFEIILKSPVFLTDLLSYLRGSFNEDLRSEIGRKIRVLVEKWDKEFNTKTNKRSFKYLEIKNYITKDRHCKLPWTFLEAEEAVRKVYNLINNYASQGLKELPI